MLAMVDASVEGIFNGALEIGTEAERATFVEEASGGDVELWERLGARVAPGLGAGGRRKR
jgi:hypothetical protein